jgi:hypothetical protein
MTKLLAMGLGVIGLAFLVGSMMVLSYPDVSKWFPVLLIAGGVLVWQGVRRFRVV